MRKKTTTVHFMSEKHDWKTPNALLVRVLRCLDQEHFNTDVCASEANVPALQFFDSKNDGLSQVWKGFCWMNPPYGRKINRWIQKARESKGSVVVCLLPARTDTKWWQEHVSETAELVVFLRGRVRFIGATASAPFPSAIVIFGKLSKRTVKRFINERLGWVIHQSEYWRKR